MASDGPSPALKLIVYSMGALLVGGMLLLAALMTQKARDGTLFKDTGKERAKACGGAQVDVRGKGALLRAELDEQKASLWLDSGGGRYLLMVADACTGAAVREVEVLADVP